MNYALDDLLAAVKNRRPRPGSALQAGLWGVILLCVIACLLALVVWILYTLETSPASFFPVEGRIAAAA